MLAELPESEATGRIAEIYAEIRYFSGVPYVSSLQRYLATMPGALEWAWDALRPAMASGVIPETGWRLAKSVRLAPPRPADLDLDPATVAAVRNIAANFVRVSPVNLVTGACLARLLTGAAPAGPDYVQDWVPPAMLPPMPELADAGTVPSVFVTEVDGRPFVPALYRQVAHWPAVLAWLAEELGPRFAAPETADARAAFRQAARAAAPDIVARLPGVPDSPRPDEATTARILATIDRYAQTSPEMTMFGQLILEAVPSR
jgi:hypothetical protein